MPGHAAELSVLNWQGYGTDEPWAVEIFTQQTGVKVVHDNFNSEQEMLTKLRTSPGAYDVVLINSSYTCEAAREGLIQPIAPELIANFKDLSPNIRDSSTLKRLRAWACVAATELSCLPWFAPLRFSQRSE